MKLFVGLGNPGSKYRKTRHNVGWMVLDALEAKIFNFQFSIFNQVPNSNFQLQKQFDAEILKVDNVILAKPQTFMNESGKAVKKLVDFYKIDGEDFYIIHDDLDIRLGEYKIQKGKGPKVHGGINSIERELGREDFWRVRVGVDNRDSENRIPGEEYVLMEFTNEERDLLRDTIRSVLDELTTQISR